MDNTEMSSINMGDYVIVQRQGYTKLQKLKPRGTVVLGKDTIEIEDVVEKPYFSTFRMIPKANNQRVYMLEETKDIKSVTDLCIDKSGLDNRNITDDGQSQQLTKDEIVKLRETSDGTNDLVEKLINNSKTFMSKTEYSQEKYLKKKEKKYFEYIQIRRPTVRLMAQMFYRQDPGKTLGIRIDDLSQMLAYSDVQHDGNYVLYDSGTNGLLTAAVMERIGRNTDGKLVHTFPGSISQKTAYLAMQFPEEQTDRCINVNIYSVLRCYHQNKSSYDGVAEKPAENVADVAAADEDVPRTDSKKRKRSEDDSSSLPPKKKCWEIENEKACKVLINKVDGLIVAAKEHPVNIVKELSAFLKEGRTLVVYCLTREPLQELYVYLKSRTDFVFLRLSSTVMRNYQVLEERTHPEVSMTMGGYILTGFKIA